MITAIAIALALPLLAANVFAARWFLYLYRLRKHTAELRELGRLVSTALQDQRCASDVSHMPRGPAN